MRPRNDAELDRLIEHCDANRSPDPCLERLQSSDWLVPVDPAMPNGPPTSQCLPAGEEQNGPRDPRHKFHVIWKGPLTRHIMLNIKSFLFTQNLAASRLIVWINHPAYSECIKVGRLCDEHMAVLKRFNASVEVRILGDLTSMREALLQTLSGPPSDASHDVHHAHYPPLSMHGLANRLQFWQQETYVVELTNFLRVAAAPTSTLTHSSCETCALFSAMSLRCDGRDMTIGTTRS
jgi:hypothetical protein